MPIVISPLTEEDIPGAIDTIQQAFADDPYNRWIYDERSKLSLTRNRVSLGIRCRWGIRNALFHVAKDPASATPSKVLGVAMWLPPTPPSAPQTWDAWFQSWQLWLQQLGMNAYYGRGGLNVRRYWIWKANQAIAQKELWTDEAGYYFCNIVTVLPEWQGKGVGRRLVGEVLERADREGRRCYLESSREVPNTEIYERLGFRKVKEMECDDAGSVCRLYCMVREPRGLDGRMRSAWRPLAVDGRR